MFQRPEVAFLCNNDRVEDLNKRIASRTKSDYPIQMQIRNRAVPTRYTKMPIMDVGLKPTESLKNKGVYNLDVNFHPSRAPFNGYMRKVDDESKLRNIIFPLQDCPQSKFIPSSISDLYIQQRLIPRERNSLRKHELLNRVDSFKPFNPNELNLGNNTFHNHTREQTKDIK